MKLIFLDVDGVLNFRGLNVKTKSGHTFVDEYCVLQLKRIVQATKAQIILSSSWRKGLYSLLYNDYTSLDIADIRELVDYLAERDIKIFSATPLSLFTSRAAEIQMFLEHWDGERIENYVILDNMKDMSPLNARFVRTDSDMGLTPEKASEAIRKLNNINLCKSILV